MADLGIFVTILENIFGNPIIAMLAGLLCAILFMAVSGFSMPLILVFIFGLITSLLFYVFPVEMFIFILIILGFILSRYILEWYWNR